jgi:hypothetical protein
MTQPWLDDGARLLPSALFIDYANRIRDLKAEFHHAADEFASEYPIYVEDSKVRLGRLFSVSDYPGRYSQSVRIRQQDPPLPRRR